MTPLLFISKERPSRTDHVVGIIISVVGVGGGGAAASIIGGGVGEAVGGGISAVVAVGGIIISVVADRISLRNWNLRGLFGVRVGQVNGWDAIPAVSGLMAGAAWQVMCMAARLMPRPAGSRWLAEAGSFLSEAPPAQRRPAIGNYLVTAPQVIAVSWAGHLTRLVRRATGAATARRNDAAGDPRC